MLLWGLAKIDYMYSWELPHVAAAIKLAEEFTATEIGLRT